MLRTPRTSAVATTVLAACMARMNTSAIVSVEPQVSGDANRDYATLQSWLWPRALIRDQNVYLHVGLESAADRTRFACRLLRTHTLCTSD